MAGFPRRHPKSAFPILWNKQSKGFVSMLDQRGVKMKPASLEIMCCPICYSSLSLSNKLENKTIVKGDLHCSTCDRKYPIRDGIVHFLDPQDLSGSNQHFARQYDRLAPFYSIFSKLAFLPFGGERKAREEILERLGQNDGRLLEISIGNGANLPFLIKSSPDSEIFGIDISIGMLSQCSKLVARHNWPVDLFSAMAEALPFRDETFDNVLHIGGINFFSDRKRAIEEMIRIARPGGKIIVADEAEHLAKFVRPSSSTSSQEDSGGSIEKPIKDLVPDTIQEFRMEGIWKGHGKYHGYCLEIHKP